MPDLISALQSSAGAMQVFQQALETISNNVANSSTPGYAAQTLSLEALPFQPNAGLPGGVSAGAIQSARTEYAEQNVRQQVSIQGTLESASSTLGAIQTAFPVTSNSGIAGALNSLFQNFSAWSVTPASGASRQSVLDAARRVVQTFQQAASGLAQDLSATNQRIQQALGQVNNFASQLAADNQQIQSGKRSDAALDAHIHSTLESLSQYADITASQQSDGTWTVLMGGQTPLVIGSQTHQLSLSFSTPAGAPATVAGGTPPARILDSDGNDATAKISQGQLAGLLQVRNAVLPSLIGGAYQQGGLNVLAQGVADRVNQLLTSGNISDGPPPVPGVPLFTYNAARPTAIAGTIAVNNITADQLAAIDPGPPQASNGIALRLAQLAQPASAADEINGYSYTEFFGSLAAQVGQQASNVQEQLQVQQQTVAQARSLRSQQSGVSLNEEAARLVEFQTAYQATAHMVTILDGLTQATIDMLR